MVELHVKYLKDIISKSLGLITETNNTGVYFKTYFGIHTYGLKIPIDVLILNNSNQVVKLSKGLKPYRILIWSFKYNQVVELPNGTIENNQLKLGDKVNLVFD